MAVVNQSICVVVAFWNYMNNHVQGILHPALNGVRAEICISAGQAALKMLQELEEQTGFEHK